MRKIEVKYDGKYPSTCMGNLVIIVDGETVYNKSYCCRSTGSVSFTKDWDEIVESGELVWNLDDANQFDEEIRAAVQEKLAEFHVCCGGCV